MIMPLFRLQTNPIMTMPESSPFLNVCEKILGSLCIAPMTFIVHENATLLSLGEPSEKAFFIGAMAALLLNFFGWALYFAGHTTLFVMLFFIVLLPPLFYVLIGLWRKNVCLALAGSVFLLVHLIHVWDNLKMGG